MVWLFPTGKTKNRTTTENCGSNSDSSSPNKKYRINYHLLSQSKLRQQHLLRCYVRTNNLTRIKDYYHSIQNYYYQSQLVLERTQQQKIRPPPRRRPVRRGNRETVDDVADDDSMHIRIEYECGGGFDDDDDDDDSSCVHRNDANVALVPTGSSSPTSLLRHRAHSHPHNDRRRNPNRDLRNIHQEVVAATVATNRNDENHHSISTTPPPLHHHHVDVAPYPDAVTVPVLATSGAVRSSSPTYISPVYTMLDIDASINPNETLRWTILYYACFHHQYEIVRYLIEDCYASMKCTDRYHNTILHWVCHYPLPPPAPTTVPVSSHRSDGQNTTATSPTTTTTTTADGDRVLNGRSSTKTNTSTTASQIIQNLFHSHGRSRRNQHIRTTTSNRRRSTRSVDEVQLLLQYIMECAPSLLFVCNNYKELPIHWLCQYGNNNLVLIQCMIQFLQTNPYFVVTTTTTPDTTISSSSSSSSSSLQRLLQQEDQYRRTPMDVARYYHNDRLAEYLQSLLLFE
jgi:hypothetical protein